MPAFNSERYIASAIRSILNQTYKNIELIVYDDGSSDGTRKVIEGFSDLRMVKIFVDTNLGVVAARNHMLDIARGEYIALMDSDDLAHVERLERQLAAILKNKLDICGTSQFVLNQLTGEIKRSHDKFQDADLRALLTIYCPLCNSTIMGKADIFKKMRYDESFLTSEDYYLWARIAASGYCFGNLRERLITYRVYPEQATALYPLKFRESTELVQARYLELLGLSSGWRPRPLPIFERLPIALCLIKKIKNQFPGMSFSVGCEIYSRFQRKGGLMRSLLRRVERFILVSTVFISPNFF